MVIKHINFQLITTHFAGFLFPFVYFLVSLFLTGVGLFVFHLLLHFLFFCWQIAIHSLLHQATEIVQIDYQSLATLFPTKPSKNPNPLRHHACPKLRCYAFEQDVPRCQGLAGHLHDHCDWNLLQLCSDDCHNRCRATKGVRRNSQCCEWIIFDRRS